ncbi:UBC core domain-containing protein [Aphelenchoides besseyi]|nr:UBC core domain-containing protein [Aphelenchoides besseyi]
MAIGNGMAMKRLQRELRMMKRDMPSGVTAEPTDGNLFKWHATIEGPANSPFANGIFHLEMVFTDAYPIKAPQVRFITRVYHPNISDDGSICLDILKKEWSLALTIRTGSFLLKSSDQFSVLLSIQSLLCDPNAGDPLNGHVANVYKTNRRQYNETAKEWTEKYAKK